MPWPSAIHIKHQMFARRTSDTNFIQVEKWKHHPNKWIKQEVVCQRGSMGMTGGSCDSRQWGGNNDNVTFSWIIKCPVLILARLKMLHFHLWVWGCVQGYFFFIYLFILTAVLLLISETVWADQVVRQAFRAVAAQQQQRCSH